MKKTILSLFVFSFLIASCGVVKGSTTQETSSTTNSTQTTSDEVLNVTYVEIFSKISDQFNSQVAPEGMRTTRLSEDYSFVFNLSSQIARACANLYQHEEYDAHTRITKWLGKYDSSGERIVGYQAYSKINFDTGEVNIRYSQGDDADWYHAVIALDVYYDFNNNTFDDFYLATSSLDRDFSIMDGPANEYIKSNGTITQRNDNSLFFEKIDEYIKLAPTAYQEKDTTLSNLYSEAVISAFNL